jgi:LysM domain
MSVMTAGEQKRRAEATRGRPLAAGTPGQQPVAAAERRSGPAASGQRHRAAAQRIRHLTVVPPPQPSKAAPPAATGAAPTQGHAVPPQARRAQTVPPQAAGSPVKRPGAARAGAARAGAAPLETAHTRPVRTRVRLTRRGRIVVATLITAGVVLVAALAWLAGTTRAEAAGSGSPASAVYHSLRSVVVQPGESLWTIATRADPAGDPRTVMQEIIDINALHGTSVQPGQRLWLPRG